MKCPNCGHRRLEPTTKQRQAYFLCYIRGLNQCDASKRMGISQPALCKLLKRLKDREPSLFFKVSSRSFSFDESRDTTDMLGICNATQP